MCRIAGIIDHTRTIKNLQQRVKQMCTSMAHGGPDDEGFYSVADNIVFGHRRLALIDLTSTGHQPMLYRHLTITFNGEIYNYQTLKKQLINEGYEFNTQSDTEVILIGYHAWGINLFKKLEGMFAFALHNAISNKTYLVRDQAGIKPLYYRNNVEQLIFASEVKAFKKSDFTFTESKNWKAYFLMFGHIPHPYTTLSNVFSLQAGYFLCWDHNNSSYNTSCFLDLKTGKTIKTVADASESIKIKLEEAVENHLIADAPIGVFLSGGIDSSIITLLAGQKVKENLNTLSINFAEEAFTEEKYQKIVCKETLGKHQSYQVTEADFNTHFQSVVNAMDQPTNDGVNSWFVNKFAKQNGLKAVLSGIGADELLGGYPSFKRMGLIKKLKKLPKSFLRLTAYLPNDKLKRLYFLSFNNPIGEYLFLRGFFNPKAVAKLLNCPKAEIDSLIENFPLEEDISKLTASERVSWFETNIFMKNQLLKDTDFMSMAHGIEVRVPFLDQEFIKTVQQIENSLRFPERPKGLLIKAFKDILPQAIWDRPKMGFSFPLQSWFLKADTITESSIYKNNTEATKLITEFKKGKLHWSKAFALYQVFKNK